MPVDQRPAGSRRGAPAAVKPRFHLRLPDVYADERVPAPRLHDPDRLTELPRDSSGRARIRLSEERFREGHQQVTAMIEGLRGKRRRVLKRLWAASVALTALSVVALAVEVLGRMDLLSAFGDPVIQTADQAASESPRPKSRPATPGKSLPNAPREWANKLPGDGPVRSAVYETDAAAARQGAWLPGTITDNDSDNPHRGVQHDDHQPRSE